MYITIKSKTYIWGLPTLEYIDSVEVPDDCSGYFKKGYIDSVLNNIAFMWSRGEFYFEEVEFN